MRNGDIDRAIDDVARDLTAGEPDGALRAHVMARIERGERVGRRWSGLRIMSPVMIAALIALVLAGSWSYRSRRSPERLSSERVAVLPGERPASESVDKPALRPEEPILQPAAVRLARRTSPEPARARATTRSDVAALAPTPLGVPSIAVAPIDRGDSIQLQQLEPIAPIDVAPLGSDPEGVRP